MKPASKRWDLPVIAAFFVVAIVVFHLVSARAGYPFFRDQHLGAALDYAKNGINWMNPIIPGFNANGVGTPQEIPLWQALASLPLRTLGGWWGWANVVSLLLFSLGIPPVWLLARSALGERGAWWTTVAFLSQPLIFVTSGQASADGLSLVAALWSFYALSRVVDTGAWLWFAAAALLSAVSAATKLPLFMCMGLASFFYLLLTNRKSVRAWCLLGGAGLFAALVFFFWNGMAEQVLFRAEFPHEKLWLKDNPTMWAWYFGDWSYRLNPFNYAKGGWAALNCLLGSFFLVVALPGGFIPRVRSLTLSLLPAALLTTLVFSHLVLVHRHYYVLYSLGVAICLGSGFLWLETKFQQTFSTWLAPAFPIILAVAISLSTVQGLMGMKVLLNYDTYPEKMARIIRDHVAPTEKILIDGGGWGDMLIRSGRDGLTIYMGRELKDPKTIQRLKELGYTKLVALSESPLLWALKKTDPGSVNLERESYKSELPDSVKDWPSEFETEDILIKSIPK